MQCVPLRRFLYSTDGTTEQQAEIGVDCDIPGKLLPALIKEGYVRMPVKAKPAPKPKPVQKKDAGPAPENKMESPGPKFGGSGKKK